MSLTEFDQSSCVDMKIEGNLSTEMNSLLLIDLVLNGIFEYLQVEDLKECRTVCSFWNSSVLYSSSWKRKVKVCVRRGEMRTFSKFVANGTCFSGTYSIDVSNIPMAFWSNCGTWIKVLRLRSVTFQSKKDFRTVVYNACPNMEQLSLFRIAICQGDHDQLEELEPNECTEPKPGFGERKNMKYLAVHLYKEREVDMWMELLCHFLNLEALHLVGSEPKVSFSGFFDLFRKIRQKFPNKLKLKHVSIHTLRNPYPGLFQILKDPGLRLESINTNQCCYSDDFHDVLSMHASSLKKLRFRFPQNQRVVVDPHRIFPLQSARFGYCGLDALHVLEVDDGPFLSLAILNFTPNLGMLKLSGKADGVIDNTQESEMGVASLEKCKRLISHIDVMSIQSLKKLVTWLPNVEKLELFRLTNDYFQMICESWSNLVTFIAHNGNLDDLGITGLDEEDVRRINENGESCSWRPITVPRANLTTLKDLRSLYIRRTDGYSGLGYCAASCGVQLVPKLERLCFRCYNLEGGSIWERLQSRLPEAEFRLRELQDLSDAFYI